MVKLIADETDRQIGKRIQLIRREKNITAQVLAERIGISQQQLSRYETGTNKINVSHLVNIAVELKVPISLFFLDSTSTLAISEPNIRYAPVIDSDLKNRFELLWPKLNNEQRRLLILFLEQMI